MSVNAHSDVTVIIPVYRATFLDEALASVMSQHRPPDEIIVIDDGSPDQAAIDRAVARSPGRITAIRQANGGAGAARNAGLAAARTEWVAFLDADDWWLPDFLDHQMTYLAHHPGTDLVWADATLTGASPAAGRTFMSICPSSGAVTLESLLAQTCNVLTSAVVARRTLLMACGAFDETLLRGQDFDLWLRVVAGGARAAFRDEVLAVRRVHGNNLSGTRLQELERARDVFEKALRTLPLPPAARAIARQRLRTLEGELACEHGKHALIEGDLAAARRLLDQAHRQAPNWKLLAARCGLRLAPQLVRRLYRAREAAAPVDASSAI